MVLPAENLEMIFAIALLALLLPDAYIAFVVLKGASTWVKLLVLLPALAGTAVLYMAFASAEATQPAINTVVRLTVCVLFPVVIFTLISLAGRVIGIFVKGAPRVSDFAGLAAAALWMCIAVYGSFFGWKRICVKELHLDFSELPGAFDGYRIVQLSDFHIGTYGSSPESVQRIVEEVCALHPDLIVFTGDLVNAAPEELAPFEQELRRLHAPDGILSVLGNHDYCMYAHYDGSDSPEKAAARLIDAERALSWRVLRNEAVKIVRGADSMAVAGVENAGSHRFPDSSDLDKALQDTGGAFTILLSHDPSQWRREVIPDGRAALTLSGHTHAMQFRIGSFSPSRWIYPEWGGVYRSGSQTLVVSTGTGGNAAFRFGAYPQILLITLGRGTDMAVD